MRGTYKKMIYTILVMAVFCGCLAGCGQEETPQLQPEEKTAVITISVDGKNITIENTANKTVAQLLEQAEVVLGAGDVLSVPSGQQLDGDMTVQVLRKCKVTLVVVDENGNETRYNVALIGATVADALEAVGLQLSEKQQADQDLQSTLADGMVIRISPKEEEKKEPEPSNNNYTPPAPTTPKPTTPKPTTPKPTTAPTTPPEPTQPPRTVVSVQVYEDCDGSGHGVKVITYSDGTQEEVYF